MMCKITPCSCFHWETRLESTCLDPEQPMSNGTISKLKIVGVAVVVLLVLIVVLQNTQAIETKLLFLTVTMPNAALLFGTLITGFAIGVLTAGHIASRAKQGPLG